MEGALWLLGVLAAPVTVALLSRRLGLSRGQTITCAAIALVGTLAMMAGFFYTSFAECLGENRYPPAPLSWPWSPRREFCSDGDSWAARGGLLLLVLPFALTGFGAFLWARRLAGLAAVTFGLIVVTPLLPTLYISQLPYYRLDTYPILHNPYVRPASDEAPARVCYAYGIVHGPAVTEITEETERTCVDLARTADADQLVPDYERLPFYSTVLYNLEWLGKRLTESDMEAGTSYRGLVAERVYSLPGPTAREGAFFVRTTP